MKKSSSSSNFLPKKNFYFDENLFFLDPLVPSNKRLQNFLEAVKDLHGCRVGIINVQWEFAPDAPPLQTALTKFLIRKKNEN